MAGYRPLPPSSPMLSHQNNRGPIYHHPMNNHGIVYPPHSMNGPINMHGQHNTHHHHLMTRHHMGQQPRQMLHHSGITMAPKVMPLNASKLFKIVEIDLRGLWVRMLIFFSL